MEGDGERMLRLQKSLLRKGHAQAKGVDLNTVGNRDPRPMYTGSHVPVFEYCFWKLNVIFECRNCKEEKGVHSTISEAIFKVQLRNNEHLNP